MHRMLLWPRGLKAQAFVLSTLVFLVLQVWRPCFFLTDDALSGGLPAFTEMGRSLMNGQSPFYSDYLFGGHYFLLSDTTFSLWHPIYFLISIISQCGGGFYEADIQAYINLQIAIIGFVTLAEYFRKEYLLTISDTRILIYALSFDYNLYVLNVGSSWANFLVNHSVLPWLMFALWQKTWRAGWGLTSILLIHEILAGHVAIGITNGFLLTLVAAGYSIQVRLWRPFLIWVSGCATACFTVIPILLPAIAGFFHSHRSGGLSVDAMTVLNIPAEYFFLALFAGPWTAFHPGSADVGIIMPIESFMGCAAAWCIAPALLSFRPLKKLEQLILFILVVNAILIIRPLWISEVFSHVPLLKSLRWPFREILQFQFFFHFFLVIREPGMSLQFQKQVLILGISFFIFPLLFLVPAPALNYTDSDRELIFSGQAKEYWRKVKTLLKPGEMIVPVVPSDFPLERQSNHQIPQCLLGNCDYPAYFQVLSASGYSASAPLDQTVLGLVPHWPYGSYSTQQMPQIVAEAKERSIPLRFIVLEGHNPLKIEMVSLDGTSIDLTPFIPPKYTQEFKD